MAFEYLAQDPLYNITDRIFNELII